MLRYITPFCNAQVSRPVCPVVAVKKLYAFNFAPLCRPARKCGGVPDFRVFGLL